VYDQKTEAELDRIVSNGYRRLSEVLAAKGIDIRSILSAEHINRGSGRASDQPHQFSAYCDVVKRILCEFPIGGLGLRTGNRMELTDFGILGYALLSSASLRQSLDLSIKYRLMTSNLIDMSLRCRDGVAISTFWETRPLYWPQPYLIEEALTATWKIFRTLLPELASAQPICIHLAYPAPPYAELYEQIFACPVSFDESANEIWLPEHWLDISIVSADLVTTTACTKRCDLITDDLANIGSIVDRVRRILLSSPMRPALRLADVATNLHVSPRTLRQQLYDAGTNFKEILNEVRMRLAMEYLEATPFCLQEIAYLLGYDHSPNFYRAFKNVTGITPSEYLDKLGTEEKSKSKLPNAVHEPENERRSIAVR
jgi:AraC-like DNA-binding protein